MQTANYILKSYSNKYLTLALLMLFLSAKHVYNTLAPNDFAIAANFLY